VFTPFRVISYFSFFISQFFSEENAIAKAEKPASQIISHKFCNLRLSGLALHNLKKS
jgi:hypothetical protein